MAKTTKEINKILLEGHRRGQEYAKEVSIRTGVALVVEKNGKIKYIKPKFKYILVPINLRAKINLKIYANLTERADKN